MLNDRKIRKIIRETIEEVTNGSEAFEWNNYRFQLEEILEEINDDMYAAKNRGVDVYRTGIARLADMLLKAIEFCEGNN